MQRKRATKKFIVEKGKVSEWRKFKGEVAGDIIEKRDYRGNE